MMQGMKKSPKHVNEKGRLHGDSGRLCFYQTGGDDMQGKSLSFMGLMCFIAILLFPNLLVQAEESAGILPSPVTITDFEMNTHSAKSGDVVTYNFTITDVGISKFIEMYGREYYGVYCAEPESVVLEWSSSNQQTIVQTYEWGQKWTDEGLWVSPTVHISGKIPIRKGMEQGQWKLTMIRIYTNMYDGEEIYIQDSKTGTSPVLMDFSMADFTVSGTGKADNKAPTIVLKSLKTSKRYVKKNQKSTFSVKVKDQSTIKKVRCDWLIYDDRYAANWEWTSSYKMKYNKKKKRYQCSVTLNGEPEEKAALYQIYVEDIYGNKAIYRTDLDTYHYQKRTRRYYNAYRKMIVIVK